MAIRYFKYNKDDILEIVTEALAQENGLGTFNARADLVIDNGEIFFVGAIGELENSEVDTVDLKKLFSEMAYNGTHAMNKGLSAEELSAALEKAIRTKDF